MSYVRLFRRPIIILATTTVADAGGRLGFGFEMSHILALEAALFGTASFLLVWAARRDRVAFPVVSRLDLCLAVFFALGGLRAGLWFGGLPVAIANLVVLAAGLSTIILYGVLRWLVRREIEPKKGIPK